MASPWTPRIRLLIENSPLSSWHIDDASSEVRFNLKNRRLQPGSGPKSAHQATLESHLQMKRGRRSWRPLFTHWSLLGPVLVRGIHRERGDARDRPEPPLRETGAQPKAVCVDLVHEDEWELDGTVRILTHKQPLRAGFAERTLGTSGRTYGGCRPCHGSSKLRSRNAQPKPP